MAHFLSLTLFVFIIAYTPGPNNVMSMSIAARYGFRSCAPFNFGVIAGMFVVCASCALFAAALFDAFPSALFWIRCAGAAYMAYLAWHIYASPKKISTEGDAPSAGFRTGLLLQLVNPKVYIVCITAMSSYIIPKYGGGWALPPFIIFIAVFAGCGSFAWAAFGSAFRGFFNRHLKAFNTAMALLLIYCAISLFF